MEQSISIAAFITAIITAIINLIGIIVSNRNNKTAIENAIRQNNAAISASIIQSKKSIRYQLILNIHSQWMYLGFQSGNAGLNSQYKISMTTLLNQMIVLEGNIKTLAQQNLQSLNQSGISNPQILNQIDTELTKLLQEIVQ